MKKAQLLSWVVFTMISTTNAQTVKYTSSEKLEQRQTSVLNNSLGAMNGNYLVIEDDFGGALDMKNNIRSKVRRYSVSNLNAKNLVYLNPLVGNGAADDKIIFTDIFRWHDRIISFYTIKGKMNRKEFPIYARFFDRDLKPIGKDDVALGTFYSSLNNESFRLTLPVDGRNTAVLRESFFYSLSPDSSKLLLFLQSPENGNFSVKLRILDRDLNQLNEVNAVIPVPGKEAELSALRVSNNGTVYLMLKNFKTRSQRKESKDEDDYSTELYSVNPATGKIQTKSIYIPGKSIRKPNLTIDALSRPTVICTFSDDINDLLTVHGLYALKLDPVSLAQISSDQHRFSQEVLLHDVSEKDIKKGRGMLAVFMDRFTHRPDGGMYAIGRWSGKESVRYGTVADGQSVGYNVYRTTIFCFIDPSGKIRWCNALETKSASINDFTIVNGAVLFMRDNKAVVGYATSEGEKKKDKVRGLQFDSFDDNGVKTNGKLVPFTEELKDFEIVTSTFARVSDDEYIICLHYGAEDRKRKVNEMAVAKIKF